MRKEGLSLQTKREYKKTLKKFFNWLGKRELVDWFTVGEIKTRKFPDELLTEDDIKKLLNASKTQETGLYISVLWESGCRVIVWDFLIIKLRILQKRLLRELKTLQILLLKNISYLKNKKRLGDFYEIFNVAVERYLQIKERFFGSEKVI